ncbi:MAG TPA: type VI secretion system baseplate subunit TssF [Bryobacteraceae bacterium]|nr:type VI secretion system baseplate subunit TssF [Bryobacteraceae bacterium]
MRDELLFYYERELTFLRHMGAEFAERYPKVASRLLIEPDKCDDPHVERLLEAFAFLAARVHLKIDDEFPEITEALLSIVYPHLIRPIPSASIVQFHRDPEQGKAASGTHLERETVLYSRPIAGVPCKFRTCYDTMLWPVEVAAAEFTTPDRLTPPIRNYEAAAALRFELRGYQDVELPKLGMQSLRIYLNGESNLVHSLYELLCCNALQVWIRDTTPNSRVKPVLLPPSVIRPVGFTEDESLLPYPKRSFDGYRLMQEYFAFPEKFFFIDFQGLDAAFAGGFRDRAEVIVLFSPYEIQERKQMLEIGVSDKTIRLNCAPIINLFPQTAEPILVDQRKYEYPIVPDLRRLNAIEIFSIDQVAGINPQTRDTIVYEPFYSYRHATLRTRQQTFWLTTRRVSNRQNDEGTDMYLSLVDLSTRPVHPDVDTITIRTTCTNRDLPSRLPFGSDAGDFELETASAIKRIVCLKKPTGTLRPIVGKSIFWRLISHLSLNYLSLVEEGKESLQEILKLYNFTDSTFSEKQINGITSLKSDRHFARIISENGVTFARGSRVEMEFDEEQFVGGGVYLFASVLERFLGLYVSLNSFSQLVARTRQRKEVLKEWPPRAGQRILL